MKYIKRYNIFESKSVLLDLEDNVDKPLINKITSLISNGKILEISCGNGADTIELSKMGYDVYSTDYDDGYVNSVNNKIGNCIKLDTRENLPYRDGEFDMVYSRLGLHYFTIEELYKIFSEIERVTSKYFIFTVKLKNDNLSNNKIIIEPEIWEKITNIGFNIISSEQKHGLLYNSESKWLEIVAKKRD